MKNKTTYRVYFSSGYYEYWEYNSKAEALKYMKKILDDKSEKNTLILVKLSKTVLGKYKNY